MDLMELLNGPLGQSIMEGAASHLGKDRNQTASALQAAIPMLMGALKKNASDPNKAAGLMSALTGKHNGGLLDQITDIFGGGSVNEEVVEDGDKILGHVLGEKKEVVAAALSKQSGLDTSSAMDILKMAAPVVMNMIGKQASQSGVSDHSGLADLIGNMLGGSQETQHHSSLIEKLLDTDNDGSIVDDLFNMGRKFFGN